MYLFAVDGSMVLYVACLVGSMGLNVDMGCGGMACSGWKGGGVVPAPPGGCHIMSIVYVLNVCVCVCPVMAVCDDNHPSSFRLKETP